jgi:type I restriction enzyme, S subunit
MTAGEWPTLTIAECASSEPYSTQIGPFGEKLRAEDYTPTGAPVLRGTNVNPDGRFHDDDFVFINSDWAEAEFSKFVCEADDVILCHKGTLGKIGVIPKKSRFKKYIMGNSMLKVRCDRSKLEPLYLYYWLCSRHGQDYLFSRVSQVGVPQIQLPLTTLREAALPVPPLAEQKAIAAVLGALDDRIELNRRMNATLEAMARALFQSWFVDFDPVRAKLDGRNPDGLDKSTAALFPASFQDSALGPIPKGWTISPLRELVCYLSRGIGPVYVEQGGMTVLNQKCVRDHRVDFSKSRLHDTAKKPVDGRTLEPFDVLINSTGVGTLGRVAQIIHLDLKVIVDSHITIVRASANVDSRFLGTALTGLEAEIEALGEGSTGQTELSRARLGELKLVTPPHPIQEAFGEAVGPLLQHIARNDEQSRTLATLRDTLLPKLLSGELAVPPALGKMKS